MDREPRINRYRFRNGKEAFDAGDLSAAYQLYVHEINIDGLVSVAYSLIEKKREKEALKVLKEAHRLSELENGVDK